MLDGDSSELRQHINQQVQIFGRFDAMGGGGSSAMTGSGVTGAGSATMQSSGGAQRLRVVSVQMLASSCSQQ